MQKKIMKNLIILIILVTLSFSSFSAVVSDNDGSAFVTKAEFETMKTSFAEQINNYNLSIDTKIDGAIAQYLAGLQLVKIEQLPTKYYEYKIDGNDLGWYGKTTGANIALSESWYLPNNIVANLRMYRYDNSQSKFLYKDYNGKGVWTPGSTSSGATTDINASLTDTKSYYNYIICDENDHILYFAKTAVLITSLYYNYNYAAADQPETLLNVDSIVGNDSFVRYPRWLTIRAKTDIDTKYTTALCPMSETKYNRVLYGKNRWYRSRMCGGGRNTRDMLKWTLVGETLSGGLEALFNIPKIYLPEGRNLNSAKESDKKKLNEYSYVDLIKVSPLNGASKYGVYITTTTVNGIITIRFVATQPGTVYIRTGTGASSTSTLKVTETVVSGVETKIIMNDIVKNTNIFLVYAPSNNNVGYIDSLLVEQQEDD